MKIDNDSLYKSLKVLKAFLIMRTDAVHLQPDIERLGVAINELVELRELATKLLPDKIHIIAYSLKQLENYLCAINLNRELEQK